MNEFPENQAEASDEVSMIDLVVVVLRWRRFIFAIVALAIAVSIGLVAWTKLRENPLVSVDWYMISSEWKFVKTPLRIRDLVESDVGSSAQAYSSNLAILVPAFQEGFVNNNPSFEPDAFDKKGSLEAYVIKYVVGKTLKVGIDPTNSVFTMTMYSNDIVRSKAFLDLLMKRVIERVKPEFTVKLDKAHMVLDKTFQDLTATTANGTQERILALSDLKQRRFLVEQLTSDPNFPISERVSTIISAVDPSTTKEIPERKVFTITFGVTLVIGAIFGAILLAFGLEFLNRLRSNDEEMAKIRLVLANPRKRTEIAPKS